MSSEDTIFELKEIKFLSKPVRIILQNENGPCPLLAITNVMILRDKLKFNNDIVTLSEIIESIGGLFLENCHKFQNSEETIIAALETLPKLVNGLDLNIKFNDVNSFEFTQELSVFDALEIPIYHAFIVDEQDEKFSCVRNLSYNSALNKIVEYQTLCDQLQNNNTELSEGFLDPGLNDCDVKSNYDNNNQIASHSQTNHAMLAQFEIGQAVDEFIHTNLKQINFAGLCRLYDVISELRLGVLLHNNHFSVIYKNQGKLYLLVTDIGFKDEPAVIWELLDEING